MVLTYPKLFTTQVNKPQKSGSSGRKGLADMLELNRATGEVYLVVCWDLQAWKQTPPPPSLSPDSEALVWNNVPSMKGNILYEHVL